MDWTKVKPGELLGTGLYKEAFAIEGEPDYVLLRSEHGRAQRRFQDEADFLKKIRALGLPAVQYEWIGKIDGVACGVMKKYAASDRFCSREGDENLLRVLNEKSVQDLEGMLKAVLERGIGICDLQFLIAEDGSVLVSDPLGVDADDPCPDTCALRSLLRMAQFVVEVKAGRVEHPTGGLRWASEQWGYQRERLNEAA